MKKILLILTFLYIAFFAVNCKKKPVDPPVNPDPDQFKNGVFICNEGPFQSGTGTVSFFNRSTGAESSDLFGTANQSPLGNIVQSMCVIYTKGYVIVNNANKIEIVDTKNFLTSGKIDNITQPRFMIPVSVQKAYVSSWANTVVVINLGTNAVTTSIPTGTGPERMLKLGSKVFVLNQGGFGIDSTMTVIDCNSDSFLKTVSLYPKPCGVVADKNGKLWIMCAGKGYNGFPGAGDSKAHLLCLSPDTYDILLDLPFPDNSNHPDKLAVNNTGDQMFFLYKEGVYSVNVDNPVLSTSPLVRHNGSLYALDFDPVTQYLYASDPLDYTHNGWVFRYKPENGMAVDSFKAGIIPTFFCFN